MAVFTNITPTEKLRSDAAASFKRAQRAGMPTEVNDGYRSDKEQEELFFANYTSFYAASSKLDRRWYKGIAYYRRAPYSGHVAVAVPGTSNHRSGIAVDLGKNARNWMFQYGADYGWTNPAWAKQPATFEPWHWEYSAKTDKHLNEKDDDMPERKYFNRTKDVSLAPGKWTTVRVNNDGHVSLAVGASVVIANVQVQVDNLPTGKDLQIRFYYVDVKDGKTTRVGDIRRTKVETVGTAGGTYVQTSVVTGLTSTQRLRAEVWVPSDVKGAKIVNSGGDSALWY